MPCHQAAPAPHSPAAARCDDAVTASDLLPTARHRASHGRARRAPARGRDLQRRTVNTRSACRNAAASRLHPGHLFPAKLLLFEDICWFSVFCQRTRAKSRQAQRVLPTRRAYVHLRAKPRWLRLPRSSGRTHTSRQTLQVSPSPALHSAPPW